MVALRVSGSQHAVKYVQLRRYKTNHRLMAPPGRPGSRSILKNSPGLAGGNCLPGNGFICIQ